jgi:hypothetical protein
VETISLTSLGDGGGRGVSALGAQYAMHTCPSLYSSDHVYQTAINFNCKVMWSRSTACESECALAYSAMLSVAQTAKC